MTKGLKLIDYIYERYYKWNENMDCEYLISETELQELKLSTMELDELFSNLNNIEYIDFISKNGEFYKYKVGKLLVKFIEEEYLTSNKKLFEEAKLSNVSYEISRKNYYTTGLKEFDYATQLRKGDATFLISKHKDKISDNLLIQGAVENALVGVKVLLITWMDSRTVDRMIIKYISGIDFQKKNTKEYVVDEVSLQQDILLFKKQNIDYEEVAKNLLIISNVKNVGDVREHVSLFIENNNIDMVVSSIPFIDAKIVAEKAVLFSFCITMVDRMARCFNNASYVYFDSKKDVYMTGGFSVISGTQYGFEKKDDRIIITEIQ